MASLFKLLAGYVAALCQVFQVTPESRRRGRRGNLPPPQGVPFGETQ